MKNHHSLIDRLEALVDRDNHPDWEDVVRRAEAPAEATRQARRSRRSRHSYLTKRLVPVLVLAAAAFAFVLIAPWQHGPGPTVLERALAAIGDEPVLHAVLHNDDLSNASYVDLATGRETPILQTTELWYDKERNSVYAKEGFEIGGVFTIVSRVLVTPDGTWTSAGRVEPGRPGLPPQLTGFFDNYRPALENGSARVAGTGTLNGHDVIWIEWAPEPGGCPLPTSSTSGTCTERVAIDKTSSLPLQIAWLEEDAVLGTIEIASIETLPAGSGDFSKPEKIAQPSYIKIQSQIASTDLPGAVEALPTALWLGKSIFSLELTGVSRATLSSQDQSDGSAPVTATGIELQYGDGLVDFLWSSHKTTPELNGSGVVIHEQKADPDFYFWPSYPAAPAGSVLTLTGRYGWLEKNGTYVEISASSRDLLLAAARGLKPIQAPAGTG